MLSDLVLKDKKRGAGAQILTGLVLQGGAEDRQGLAIHSISIPWYPKNNVKSLRASGVCVGKATVVGEVASSDTERLC